MTPEAQHIALLEWMGWKWFGFTDNKGATFYQFCAARDISDKQLKRLNGFQVPRSAIPDGAEILPLGLPPLTLDLMHEAESILIENRDDVGRYFHHLEACVARQAEGRHGRLPITHAIAHATKEQRREALLKTIGLWKE